LQPRLNLDLTTLEAEFHRLSRKLHPDRFARALENEKQWSLADTALLNDAYRTLKDPLRRTEYLLKLEGAAIGEMPIGKDRKDASRVPVDLLEEVFELNMQLEEIREARKMGDEDAHLLASVSEERQKVSGLLSAVDEKLRAEWQAWDAGDKAARSASQERMVALLDRRRYLSNLVRDVTETLGA
jgi:molecular chaperone HscB